MHNPHVAGLADQLHNNEEVMPSSEAKSAKVRPGIHYWSNVTGAEFPEEIPLNTAYRVEHHTTHPLPSMHRRDLGKRSSRPTRRHFPGSGHETSSDAFGAEYTARHEEVEE